MEKAIRSVTTRVAETKLSGRTPSGELLFKTVKLEFFEDDVSVGFFVLRYYPKYKMVNLLDFKVKEKFRYQRDEKLAGYGSSVLQNFKKYLNEKGLVCFLIDGLHFKENPDFVKGWYGRHGWKKVSGSTGNHIYYSGRQSPDWELQKLSAVLNSRFRLIRT